MIGFSVYVGFPEPQDGEAAGPHVGVLRLIQLPSSVLAGIKGRELDGVPVPVVAVELHHQARPRDEGVHAELASDEVLAKVRDPKLVKDLVPTSLQPRLLHRLLPDVHRDQLRSSGGVGVSALEGAVRDVVLPRQTTGRGPAKGLPAHLADVFGLRSTPPRQEARAVAEVVGVEAEGALAPVDGLPAARARNFGPGLTTRAF